MEIVTTSCCGLGELYALPSNKFDMVDVLEEYTHSAGSAGALIATTIPTQLAAIQSLKDCGFREVDTFENPNTGNMVTLWFRVLSEEEHAQ